MRTANTNINIFVFQMLPQLLVTALSRMSAVVSPVVSSSAYQWKSWQVNWHLLLKHSRDSRSGIEVGETAKTKYATRRHDRIAEGMVTAFATCLVSEWNSDRKYRVARETSISRTRTIGRLEGWCSVGT